MPLPPNASAIAAAKTCAKPPLLGRSRGRSISSLPLRTGCGRAQSARTRGTVGRGFLENSFGVPPSGGGEGVPGGRVSESEAGADVGVHRLGGVLGPPVRAGLEPGLLEEPFEGRISAERPVVGRDRPVGVGEGGLVR